MPDRIGYPNDMSRIRGHCDALFKPFNLKCLPDQDKIILSISYAVLNMVIVETC